MMDAKNVWVGIIGVVADPEYVNDNQTILKIRGAVDGAGRDRDKDDYTGYFEVTYFLNDDNPNAKFVKGQMDAGNFKKGTTLGVTGRLVHERWTGADDKRASKVSIIAESLTYVGRKNDPSETDSGTNTQASAATTDIPENF